MFALQNLLCEDDHFIFDSKLCTKEFILTDQNQFTVNNEKECQTCSCDLIKKDETSFSTKPIQTNKFDNVKLRKDCHRSSDLKEEIQIELTAERNDYLRQNVMVPLTWAMARTLRYKPTDPIHYIAYQLLRWRYSVPQAEKDNVQKYVRCATVAMDKKFIEKEMEEQKELFKNTIKCMKDNILGKMHTEYQ